MSDAMSQSPSDTVAHETPVMQEVVTAVVPESTPEPAPAPFETKKWAIKANGKDREMSEAELLKYAGLGITSDERFKEAAAAKKEMESFRKQLMDGDLIQTLQGMGMSKGQIDEYLAGAITRYAEQEAMTPEQRELQELRAMKAEREAQQKLEQEERQRREEFEVIQREYTAVRDETSKAFEELGFPDSPILFDKVLAVMETAAEARYTISARDAAKVVLQEEVPTLASYIKSLPRETIKQLLGADLVKALATEKVVEAKRAEAPLTQLRENAVKQASLSAKQPAKPKTHSEFFDELKREASQALKNGGR